MYSRSALQQYQQVNAHAQVSEASPHRLIQMLQAGALDRIAQAQGAMSRGQTEMKGMLIGKAIDIIGGLREGLNLEAGGELAANYDRLYDYMARRLIEANRKNDVRILEEVAGLMRELKAGWDGIASQLTK
ncbi:MULTISPECIES: flagellar export chaperone FliS [Pseudomonas]|uniref:Flagellar secretion chaperone FliS n=1 Tax=Pseudomonas flexibilis TaxID=706570 RepID=A0A0B3BWJ5_9PSED|nr:MULTISPECIES: flagellar export chaperone FliS [Pseudomonas]KHL68407.1 flagellar biosynthesis protein FliS [Pseudomonas flexibilis]KHO65421.1 flagellar biosynthesis protein FliS [Pseudomonas flexibilis]SCY59402.1 flagellar protein FliS [Pseudomonas flexibilis]SIR43720.1 flagellar protein FliS [Pseudomonas flexibilis]